MHAPGAGRDTACSRRLFASANYLLEQTMPVRIRSASNRRASPREHVCPQQLIFDSRMRVRLCVSLTLPIVVCESPHNGVFIDPGKMTGSIFAFARRTCVLDASADTSKLPIGVCIRTVCVYRTHTRGCSFALAARSAHGSNATFAPAGRPRAAPRAAQRLR